MHGSGPWPNGAWMPVPDPPPNPRAEEASRNTTLVVDPKPKFASMQQAGPKLSQTTVALPPPPAPPLLLSTSPVAYGHRRFQAQLVKCRIF